MVYTAQKIAYYMVSFCLKRNKPISNLRLQKLLYFAQYKSLKDYDEPLFTDDISAWQYGPVVPDVYFEFCVYGGMPITLNCNANLNKRTENLLNYIIEELDKYDSWSLVRYTHKNGSAWSKIYLSGEGNGDVIPLKLIKDDIYNKIEYPV